MKTKRELFNLMTNCPSIIRTLHQRQETQKMTCLKNTSIGLMNTTTDTMHTTFYALHGAERRTTMKEQIVLTFLDVPNGIGIMDPVPKDIESAIDLANFISAKLTANPTWILTQIETEEGQR